LKETSDLSDDQSIAGLAGIAMRIANYFATAIYPGGAQAGPTGSFPFKAGQPGAILTLAFSNTKYSI
jgi:hypothetical protein